MAIEFKNVSYTYNLGTPLQANGLEQVSFKIKQGTFVALVGHTGSGKSTLMQHFNGLLKPTQGNIEIAGFKLNSETSNKGLKNLRKKVGLVFQFPESQLFEETVLKDVMLGPLNFGFSQQAAKLQAYKWLKKVGINESLFNRSPFDLSGGQMRRVAIAGVLASEPKILCLDEPAAGLDPEGKTEMLNIFKSYQKDGNIVILVTHDMNDVAEVAQQVLVMDQGKLVANTAPENLFKDDTFLRDHHLDLPKTYQFARKMEKDGFNFINPPLTIDALSEEILRNLENHEDE